MELAGNYCDEDIQFQGITAGIQTSLYKHQLLQPQSAHSVELTNSSPSYPYIEIPVQAGDEVRLQVFAFSPTSSNSLQRSSNSLLENFTVVTPTLSQDPSSNATVDGKAVSKQRKGISVNLLAIGRAFGKLFKGKKERETAVGKSSQRLVSYSAYLKIEVYPNQSAGSPL